MDALLALPAWVIWIATALVAFFVGWKAKNDFLMFVVFVLAIGFSLYRSDIIGAAIYFVVFQVSGMTIGVIDKEKRYPD